MRHVKYLLIFIWILSGPVHADTVSTSVPDTGFPACGVISVPSTGAAKLSDQSNPSEFNQAVANIDQWTKKCDGDNERFYEEMKNDCQQVAAPEANPKNKKQNKKETDQALMDCLKRYGSCNKAADPLSNKCNDNYAKCKQAASGTDSSETDSSPMTQCIANYNAWLDFAAANLNDPSYNCHHNTAPGTDTVCECINQYPGHGNDGLSIFKWMEEEFNSTESARDACLVQHPGSGHSYGVPEHPCAQEQSAHTPISHCYHRLLEDGEDNYCHITNDLTVCLPLCNARSKPTNWPCLALR